MNPEDVKHLLSLTPAVLATEQHHALVQCVLDRLTKVSALISNGDYDAVSQMLASSPAGDGHGCDNVYIDFSDVLGDNHGNGADLGDVLDKLDVLRSHIEGKEKHK